MNLLSTFFLLYSFIISQTITVSIVKDSSIVDDIERQLIDDIFILWDRKTKEKVDYQFNWFGSFLDMMDFMKNLPITEKDNHLAISSITITDARSKKFQFSNPYVPVREVLICKKNGKYQSAVTDLTSLVDRKIGYLEGTIQESSMLSLKKDISFKEFGYLTQQEKNRALLNNEIDFYIADNVNVWSNSQLKIFLELPEQLGNGYGILFHKKSSLKKIIDPILMYYMKSAKFRKLTTDKFGKEVSDYFVKKLLF